jgi:hypothetical protein
MSDLLSEVTYSFREIAERWFEVYLQNGNQILRRSEGDTSAWIKD